jgi:hypothetical protein
MDEVSFGSFPVIYFEEGLNRGNQMTKIREVERSLLKCKHTVCALGIG